MSSNSGVDDGDDYGGRGEVRNRRRNSSSDEMADELLPRDQHSMRNEFTDDRYSSNSFRKAEDLLAHEANIDATGPHLGFYYKSEDDRSYKKGGSFGTQRSKVSYTFFRKIDFISIEDFDG